MSTIIINPQQTLILEIATIIMLVIVTPTFTILFLRSNTFKRFRFWISKTPHVNVIMIDNVGMPRIEVKPLERLEDGKIMIKDGDFEYAYEPIAVNLAMIENRNAIPVVRGGYIEETMVREAITKTKANIKQTKDTGSVEEINPEGAEEKEVQKVFKWVIEKGKLKNCLIRPYTKWSSKEFKDAIKGEVVKELLRIPVSTMDLIMVIMLVATVGMTVYYGYTMTNTLNEIQSTLKQILGNLPTKIPTLTP